MCTKLTGLHFFLSFPSKLIPKPAVKENSLIAGSIT